MLLYFILHLTVFQNWLIGKVTTSLSEKLHTRVNIKHIDFQFFDKMELKGVYIEDLHKDTLLYAGSASVSITDWFFMKEKASLHYLALDEAVVNFNRTDSVWNYQFLADYFASPKKSDPKKGGIEFDFKTLHLSDIRFNQIDHWRGRDMKVAFHQLDLVADDINFTKKQINIRSLDIDQPYFYQSDYEGKRPPLVKTDAAPPATPFEWNNDGWVFNLTDLKLTNGIVDIEKKSDRAPYTDRFDGDHILFSKISGSMKNIHFEKDTLTTVAQLSTVEKSGFEVKKLASNIKFTPHEMTFTNLDIITNRSRLRNYYSMKYDDFDDDMCSFMHRVKLEGNFINSEVNSDDLSYFAPELSHWKKNFSINGTAKGTIDNLTASKMLIRSGATSVDGSIAMKGLPDINTTFIDFKANELTTNYNDATTFIPLLKKVTQPNVKALGNIVYKGNFTGFLSDFVTFGTVQTAIGTVTADLNMKLPDGKKPEYSGKVSTDHFNLKAFVDNSSLSDVTFTGKIVGTGFNTSDINSNFDGNFQKLVFAGNTYSNITIKGDIQKKIFKGLVSIDDPNLQVDSLKGIIDLTRKTPQFNFDAQLKKADLKKLHLTLDQFVLAGHLNLDFSGDNIDNFLGTARIDQASLTHNNIPLQFDSLVLNSKLSDSGKSLSLHSNNIEGEINGQFKILELPDAFKVFLSKYYPAYIKTPDYTVSDQHFTFDLETKDVDEYIQLIDKKLKGFNNTTIHGNLKLKENELNVKANVPMFSYDNKVFNNIRLSGNGNLDSLHTNVDVDDISINDSLHLPSTRLTFTSRNDISDVTINTSANKILSDASLQAQVTTLNNGVKVHFNKSSFIMNDKSWGLEKDGDITVTDQQVNISDLKFTQNDQEINISTTPGKSGKSNDIRVDLKKVNIEDFAPLVAKEPRLEGTVSGQAEITDPFGKYNIDFTTTTDQFRTDGDSIGKINTSGTYSSTSGILSFKAGADSKDNQFGIDGSYNFYDSTGNQANINIIAQQFPLSFLNTYLGDIFSHIEGIANTSDLKITGNHNHLQLTGTANVKQGSVLVNYTQCKYLFKNEDIIFNPDEIDLGIIEIRDTLNNIAHVSGKMYHHFFRDFEFDNVAFETNKLLLLNTTKKDNDQFYGKVIGKAKMNLTGSADNVLMNISGEPSKLDSSHIYLLTGNSIENSNIDYIDFIQFGNKMNESLQSKLPSSLLVNMELTANPSCKIDVILDESTGDVIKGEGEGLLKIKVGNKENLDIRGTYNITKGEYSFNFQTWVKRYFEVTGGNIQWDGDPYQAKIDINAEYKAYGVDFNNLSVNNESDFKQKSDLRVVAHLTETLLKPKIDFNLKLPQGSPLSNNFAITNRLQQFKEDDNEMNKQVSSLLLFNNFLNNNQSAFSLSNSVAVFSGTVGGVLSNFISDRFNSFLQKYIKNTSFNLGILPAIGTDLQKNVEQIQGAAKGSLIFNLLKGRLIISTGVNLDYNNPYVNTTNNTHLIITPDFNAEFLINPDGNLRVVAFNRTNYDLTGQRNKSGLGLSYRKDFDGPKRKKKMTHPAEIKKVDWLFVLLSV